MSAALSRPFGNKRYKRLFLISSEGSVTEPEYFEGLQHYARIECSRAKGKPAPGDVLKRMKKAFNQTPFRKGDKAWLVIDKDKWTDAQLKELHHWTTEQAANVKRGLAVSNPRFELWLLLHFEDVEGTCPGYECANRLKKHIPGYDKHISLEAFPMTSITAALCRARQMDQPPVSDWPKQTGTTVYRLVEALIKPAEGCGGQQ
jgi:hypothetical protein